MLPVCAIPGRASQSHVLVAAGTLGLSRSRGVAQLVRPMTLAISSALIARMVSVRMLPSAAV